MIYTKSQWNAIMHSNGPAVVLAGPGSGKTAVITERIRFLLDKRLALPEQILVITFTNAAAEEMRTRFHNQQSLFMPVVFKTFHALFYQILSNYSDIFPIQILTNKELTMIAKIICMECFHIDDFQTEIFHKVYIYLLNYKKTVEGKTHHFFTMEEEKKINMIFEEEKSFRKLIDFNDLFVLCKKILTESNTLLNEIQSKFLYILVDEYQDVTPEQSELISLLSKKHRNIFVVGDEDQSIYGFCGSNASAMKDFILQYPDAKIFRLEDNFRSAKAIMYHANKLIEHNSNRIGIQMQCKKRSDGLVKIKSSKDNEDSVLMLANYLDETNLLIKQKNDPGLPKRKIALLFRTKVGLLNFKNKLMSKIMESYNKKSVFLYLGKSEPIQDILSYLRVIHGGISRTDYIRIINRPERFIRESVCRENKMNLESIKILYQSEQKILKILEKLEMDFKFVQNLTLASGIHYIRHQMGYEEYAKKQRLEKNQNFENYFQEINCLMSLATESTCVKVLEEKLEEEKQRQKKEHNEIYNQGIENRFGHLKISFSTMHASKGLEFDVIWIIHVNEGNIPQSIGMEKEGNLEEERRLFYVALTRAKEEVYIHYIENKNDQHRKSRFIHEILDT